MRSGWQNTPQKTTSENQITQMCMMIFGSQSFSGLHTFSAGRSHESHRLTLDNGMQVILCISTNKNSLQKQHAVVQKLWRQLPVPRFLSAVQQTNGNKYFAFLEYRHGERLANLETLSTADQAQLGFEMGEYLALLHSQTFKTAGEFDKDLKISQTYDVGAIGLSQFFAESLRKAVTLGHITNAEAKKYSHNYADKIEVLSQWKHSDCLIHADLNEDNILHHQGHISAILDWEFVMSGHPAMDFGKFTRTPYINCPIFLENLCDSYYLTHKNLPANWDEISVMVDLISWAEFLSRNELRDDIRHSAVEKLNNLL